MRIYLTECDISDSELRDVFEKTDIFRFCASDQNNLRHRFMIFREFGNIIFPAIRVLRLGGVTPQMLRPVFSPRIIVVNRVFPMNFRWWGLNKSTKHAVLSELPRYIYSYDDLGSFPLNQDRFVSLAKVLKKSIEVSCCEGGRPREFCFTVLYPTLEVIRE